MATAHTFYLGDLRTRALHQNSGTEIITDAPIDNSGKGEAFSPTDLTATSLLCCMITVMAIAAKKENIDMGEPVGSVEKIMAESPRRISRLNIQIQFKNHRLTQEQKNRLEHIGINCPVAKSLHPEIIQTIQFQYD